jgi:hypothetical protein
MQKVVIAIAGLACVCMALAASSSQIKAAEVARHKIGEWGDPFTPPQSRTSCIGYASGNWPWGGGWKTCNQWKTEWRHMEVEVSILVNGPDNLDASVRQAAVDCALTAFAAAGGVVLGTSGAGTAAALAAAKVAFAACISAKGAQLADQFAISVETPSHWTDWS